MNDKKCSNFSELVLENELVQGAQLTQRDRAAECVRYGQKWKTGTGRQYFTDIIGLYLTTVASKAIEFGEKRKIRAIAPFKVIQGHRGRYQSKARMPLPIVTDILSRTVSELSQLIIQILDTAFLSHPLGGLRDNVAYDVHLGLIGKRVVDFLLVLIELFR